MDAMKSQLDVMKAMLEELLVQKSRKTLSRASTFEVDDDDEVDLIIGRKLRDSTSSLRRISEESS